MKGQLAAALREDLCSYEEKTTSKLVEKQKPESAENPLMSQNYLSVQSSCETCD